VSFADPARRTIRRSGPVAVLGAGGPPGNTGWTVRDIISDRRGNNLIDLLLLSLVTATVGWADAAATARLRRKSPCTDVAGPVHPDRKPWHRRGGVIR
jgi:hypothetical protein